MTTPHGWEHSEEMTWAAQEHANALAVLEAEKDITALKEDHSFELRRLEAGESISSRRRRQIWRLAIAVAVVAVWLGQVGYSTWQALTRASLLQEVENIVLLVGLTGALVAVLVNKVWPDNEDKKEKE
jgi:ferric-dicitrate binding protein FerR (iron transport regulator)